MESAGSGAVLANRQTPDVAENRHRSERTDDKGRTLPVKNEPLTRAQQPRQLRAAFPALVRFPNVFALIFSHGVCSHSDNTASKLHDFLTELERNKLQTNHVRGAREDFVVLNAGVHTWFDKRANEGQRALKLLAYLNRVISTLVLKRAK